MFKKIGQCLKFNVLPSRLRRKAGRGRSVCVPSGVTGTQPQGDQMINGTSEGLWDVRALAPASCRSLGSALHVLASFQTSFLQ